MNQTPIRDNLGKEPIKGLNRIWDCRALKVGGNLTYGHVLEVTVSMRHEVVQVAATPLKSGTRPGGPPPVSYRGVRRQENRFLDIYQALWRWAKRRHRKKGARWIRRKYFDGQWTFHGRVRNEGGTWRNVELVRPVKVPIVRHIKVRAAANPYDPEWEPYFEKRLQRKMEAKLQGKRSLLYLWRSQNGVCPVCGEGISEETGWENHHIEWRVHGGSDTMDNRVLLHPACHRQIHCLG